MRLGSYAVRNVEHKGNGRKRWRNGGCPARPQGLGLFVRTIQVLVEDLGHGKHVYAVLLEDSAHRIVTSDLASVVWVLQLVSADVLPELLDRLGPRKLHWSALFSNPA